MLHIWLVSNMYKHTGSQPQRLVIVSKRILKILAINQHLAPAECSQSECEIPISSI